MKLLLQLCVVLCLLATTGIGLAEDKTPQPPNILFCIADDASWPHFGAYGTEWVKTPGFDRVAREGLLFNRCYTPNAKCAPSRACILTGRNSWQLEAAANHMPFFPVKFQTWCEALMVHSDYKVGMTGKGWAPGSATDADGKPRRMTGEVFQKKKTKAPTTAISGNDYAGNFEAFLDARTEGEPFAFWYGSTEPHRAYEYGTGISKGDKKLSDIPADAIPGFWPDNETVRTDMLDYAFEIEYFDLHLVRMLESLEQRGELDNTLVVVTSDNGMPFPRIKGQEYEFSNHLPLAIMWPKGITAPGRVIDDFVNFIDFAPTFLEVARVAPSSTGMAAMTGRSLTEFFQTDKSGQVFADRDHALIGKERHDIGRPHDWGYPIRGIVKDGLLYLRNFETDRWPVGDPVTGYLNTDGSPTKTWILDQRRSAADGKSAYWDMNFGKRPAEELYAIGDDPACMKNLADDPAYADRKTALREQMETELSQQEDPRMQGNGDIFDNYPVSSPVANYYERYIGKGEKVPAGWVNPGDFEETNPE